MQIDNSQPNFKGVYLTKNLQSAIKSGCLKKRSLQLIDSFRKQFDKSPVNTILDLADISGNRLDAQVFYGELNSKTAVSTFGYYAEDPVLNFFGLGKKFFIDKVKVIIKNLENTF